MPAIMAIPLSRYRSFAFLVGLRLLASLREGFRRRLCSLVISYSIPDKMMQITGSCGIHHAMSSRSRAVGRFASRPCLLDVCRRMPRRFAPTSSHRFISSLVLGCLPFSACLGSCLFPLAPSSMSMPLPSHCFTLPAPPHRHDGRGDTTGLWRFSRLCLLVPSSARHLISAVRHRMATGLNACLAPCPSSVPPATRSLV